MLVHDAFKARDVDKAPAELMKFKDGVNARAGPKNLRVARLQVDDDEASGVADESNPPKKRLVIVGGGWGESWDSYWLMHPCLGLRVDL